MLKIKHERTADCVVAGYRPHKSGDDAIGSLLLGLYRPDGALASVGVVGAFPMEMRRALRVELEPLVTTFDEHPWNWAKEEAGTRTPRSSQYSRWNVGKDLSFIPLRPERVLEVRYDHMEGPRFRHTAQFVRWRPDRDPQSCTYAQLEEPVSFDLSVDPRTKTSYPERTGLTLMADPKTVVEVAGREVPVSNPGKVYFPRTGHTKLDMVRYYLAVAEGRAGRGARAADGAQAVRERRGGRAVLPEARAGEAPGLDRDSATELPVGPDRGRGGAAGRGRAGVGGQPGLHRPEPAPGARARPGSPGRAAGRPGPGAGYRMAADPRRRPGGRGRSWPTSG